MTNGNRQYGMKAVCVCVWETTEANSAQEVQLQRWKDMRTSKTKTRKRRVRLGYSGRQATRAKRRGWVAKKQQQQQQSMNKLYLFDFQRVYSGFQCIELSKTSYMNVWQPHWMGMMMYPVSSTNKLCICCKQWRVPSTDLSLSEQCCIRVSANARTQTPPSTFIGMCQRSVQHIVVQKRVY